MKKIQFLLIPIIVMMFFSIGCKAVLEVLLPTTIPATTTTTTTGTPTTTIQLPTFSGLYFTWAQWDTSKADIDFVSDTVYQEFSYLTDRDVSITSYLYYNGRLRDTYTSALTSMYARYSIPITNFVAGIYTVQVFYNGHEVLTGSFTMH